MSGDARPAHGHDHDHGGAADDHGHDDHGHDEHGRDDHGHDDHGHDGPARPHGHGHDHAADYRRAGARHAGRLAAAFAIVAVVLVVEVVVGLAADSLALLSDAGHMATDALGLGMALAAIHLASRGGQRSGRSFGLYRLEILAALANALLLFGVAVYVAVEAVSRLDADGTPDGLPVLVAATVGLVANLAAFRLLQPGAAESVNVRGAYLEVLADLVGSVGVLVAAAVFTLTGWGWVDPVVGAGLGLWILPRTWRQAADALRVLVQAAPGHVDLTRLATDLGGLEGVIDVHDLHVWSLTSEMEVATA
ncbi:MAG: cation diffusion facilitator family transporter, partial [Acidimicrobiia bacterium]